MSPQQFQRMMQALENINESVRDSGGQLTTFFLAFILGVLLFQVFQLGRRSE
jgi:hypothetical protein